MLIGKIPDKEYIDGIIQKAKEIGEDQIQQVEKAASKILAEVNKAKRDGKDAFIAGLHAGRLKLCFHRLRCL